MAPVAVSPVLFDDRQHVLDSVKGPSNGRPSGCLVAGGCSSVLGSDVFDDELVITAGRVCWIAGGVLRKQYSTSSPVLKAGWCYFQNTGLDKILCLLQDAALTVYTQDGDSHIVPLPGRFTGMWPLPQGVLLTGAAGQGDCILVHPLENIQRVQGAAAEGGNGWSEGEAVLWSSLEVPYLVTYNQSQRRVSVWSVSTQPAQGFVAVTPMQWPGTPKTPASQAPGLPHTPLSRSVPGSAAGGAYKRPSLRLPNGSLSPLAFQPMPRLATPMVQAATGAGDGQLLLPSQEVPIHLSRMWEQRVAAAGAHPDEAHLVTDDNGGLLLCLLSKAAQRVTALRLPTSPAQGSIEVAFNLPAVSIAAVSATFRGSHQPPEQLPASNAANLPSRDLLVLHPDGRLALLVGTHQVCTLALPSLGAGTCGGASSPVSGSSPGSAGSVYAKLLGCGSRAAGSGRGVRVQRGESSQASAMRRPSSGANALGKGLGEEASHPGGEVAYEGMALGSDSDEEMMTQAHPSPPSALTPRDTLPDVRSLADALKEPLEPVMLKDAVGNRVTVVGREGCTLRVSLPFAPTSHLATAALDALRAALPTDTWWKLYGQWLAAAGAFSGGSNGEWAALGAVVLRWAKDPASLQQQGEPLFSAVTTSSGPSSSTGLLSPAGGSTPISAPAGGAAWEQLLGSAGHRSLLARHRFQWATGMAATPDATTEAPAAQQGSKEHAWRALQALHSVYEDLKLGVLSWHLLAPLGTTLCQLAGVLGAAAYADHYTRDLGPRVAEAGLGAAAGPSSGSSKGGTAGATPPGASEPAPDMFEALHALLSGNRDASRVPALAHHRSPCVQRSVDLLAAYSILAEVAAACSSTEQGPDQLWELLEGGSQRLVLELVRRRWSLADLDALPFGVALPLRQALQHCRGSPPGDWPREAYVLIGRNDIAAGMAASQEHDKPEAVGSAIVSTCITPLGRMAKTSSPTKKPPRHPLTTPGATGAAGLTPIPSRLGAGTLCTPPLPLGKPGGAGGASTPAQLLWPPEQPLLSQPDLQPLPYTQRVLLTGASSQSGAQLAPSSGADPSSGDGMENLTHQAARLRFGRDLRLLEVRNLLRSSAPVVLKLGAAHEATDAEGAQAQQIKLTTLAARTMALPPGRGALTLGTLHPLPTEQLQIPMLCMAGRLPEQNNAVVNLDLSAAPPAPGGGAFCEYTAWPEFHNGVAAGLRLAPSGHQLTRTWIVYNKPEEPSYTHAGLLMALGLTGHLSCLAATDLYRYLSQEHDATIIGVLLGMAAAKRGTLDSSISRMLFLHLPTRHPSSYPELEISPLVQAAALMGVGLLFQGSCHRLMAEVMLEEIGRRPGTASKQAEGNNGANLHQGVTHDREGYALAAGAALGLITLGRGRAAVGVADLHLEERLRYFMLGGSESGTVASQRGLAAVTGRGSAATGEGPFGPGIIGFDPTLGEPELRFVSPARDSSSGRSGGTVAEELAAAQGSSQVVLEGELVNLDVTSPAATIALGLMYLRTNDEAIAKLFALPETHFALDFVRPEHLQLRMLMRSLVMWGSVQPTEEWVQAQLPAILKGPLSTLARGHDEQDGPLPAVDVEALAQAHCRVVAGACLAVGIRYAGSCNAPAQALLRKYLLYFVNAKQGLPEPGAGAGAGGLVGRDVLESCVGSVALALAVVMAGSGHLDTFKLLRGLRKRIAAANAANAAHPNLGSPPATSVTYGAHMALGMALGFLFMGAGALTFSTSPQAVAALVISLFPAFPISSTDNRCHLQAFRHLYALAAQPRSVDAVDVDTAAPVYVPLEITLASPPAAAVADKGAGAAAGTPALRPVVSMSKGAGDLLAQYAAAVAELGDPASAGVTFERVAPCLLPEREQVALVRVKGPRYWPQLLTSSGRDGGLGALYKTQTLFVQRKAGALPYANDPSGVRSLLSRMFHRGGAGEGGFDLVNLCATFGSDPFITSFAQVFCSDLSAVHGSFASQLPIGATTLLDFCRGALYECITREKPAALLPYLLLWCMAEGLSSPSRVVPNLSAGLPPTVPLWSLKLCMAYYTGSLGQASQTLLAAANRAPEGGNAAMEQWEPLISPLYLQSCWGRLQRALEAVGLGGDMLRHYLTSQQLPSGGEGAMLGAYLQLCGVPPLPQLRSVLESVDHALHELGVGDGPTARAAAAALLAGAFKGMPMETAQAIAAVAGSITGKVK